MTPTTKCETCGSFVHVAGGNTKYYKPIVPKLPPVQEFIVWAKERFNFTGIDLEECYQWLKNRLEIK